MFLGKSGTLQVKGIYELILIGYNMKEPVESMNGVQGVGSSNLLALTKYCIDNRELAMLLTPCFCLGTKLGSK